MINSDNLSLFFMCTGPRGSNKTLLLTGLASFAILKAYYSNYYYHTNKRIWSNYPIAFRHYSLAENREIELKAEPLNREALMTFDEEYVDGKVYVDEFDQWFDRQDWQDASQKLTAKAITQIRKKKLSLGGTMQDIDWCNKRLDFQIDIQIECRDAAFTPFGRKVGLSLGEAAFLKWKDLSGINTGYTFKENGRTYDNMFWGRRFWNCYDTNYTFDPTESMTRYKFKRQTKVIDLTAGEDLLEDTKINPNLILFAELRNELKKEGYTDISRAELQRRAIDHGFAGDWREAGVQLSKLGINKTNARGTKYSLV